MTWRVAQSLLILRGLINEAAPNRSKAADGTIGDEAHRSRNSDHNAWIKNGSFWVVSALDITDDPEDGCDASNIADALLASRDKRIKYLISDDRIGSGADGPQPWVWRPYSGANKHRMHFHISVEEDPKLYDDMSLWRLDKGLFVPSGKSSADAVKLPLLKLWLKNDYVLKVQTVLAAQGYYKDKLDGDFGMRTERAVRAFQTANGLHADGRVGPYTWEALL